MTPKHRADQFPLWPYLNQPLFHPTVRLELNPLRFWRNYQIDYLKRCWNQECEQKGHPQQ